MDDGLLINSDVKPAASFTYVGGIAMTTINTVKPYVIHIGGRCLLLSRLTKLVVFYLVRCTLLGYGASGKMLSSLVEEGQGLGYDVRTNVVLTRESTTPGYIINS